MTDDASSDRKPIGPGLFLAVVGGSGAGKDTLIAAARERFGERHNIVFPQRHITRRTDGTEPSIEISDQEFDMRQEQGAFALSWKAHGLTYGIDRSVDGFIREGRTVVVNVSRAIVPEIRRRYARSLILLIDATPDIRAARIAMRGRESEEEVRARLLRTPSDFSARDADLVIDNSGDLRSSIKRLALIILETLPKAHQDAID